MVELHHGPWTPWEHFNRGACKVGDIVILGIHVIFFLNSKGIVAHVMYLFGGLIMVDVLFNIFIMVMLSYKTLFCSVCVEGG